MLEREKLTGIARRTLVGLCAIVPFILLLPRRVPPLKGCSGIRYSELLLMTWKGDNCAVHFSDALPPEWAASMIAQGGLSDPRHSLSCEAKWSFNHTAVPRADECNIMRNDPHLFARPAACSSEKKADVLIIGSSVARGAQFNDTLPTCSATVAALSQTCGWAGLLGEALSETRGLCMATEAVSGTTVESTGWMLPAAIARHKPRIVIISLAPANEGLQWFGRSKEVADAIGDKYLLGLRALADEAASQPGVERVLLGSVYPHGHYTPIQAAVLYRCYGEMLTWPYEVLDFLTPTDDGTGRWRDGLSQETDGSAHPNAEGYRLMYESIDLRLFD